MWSMVKTPRHHLGIADTELTPTWLATAGKGFITVTAGTTDTEVKVANAAGMSVGTLRLKAGGES